MLYANEIKCRFDNIRKQENKQTHYVPPPTNMAKKTSKPKTKHNKTYAFSSPFQRDFPSVRLFARRSVQPPAIQLPSFQTNYSYDRYCRPGEKKDAEETWEINQLIYNVCYSLP